MSTDEELPALAFPTGRSEPAGPGRTGPHPTTPTRSASVITFTDAVQSYRALSKQLSALPSDHPQAEAGNQLLGAVSQYWPEDLSRFVCCEDTYRLRVAELPEDSAILGDLEACLRITEAQVDRVAKWHDDEKSRLRAEVTDLVAALSGASA